MNDLIKQDSDSLIKELRHLINEVRGRVAITVNAELTMLYWHIGSRIARRFYKMNVPNTGMNSESATYLE